MTFIRKSRYIFVSYAKEDEKHARTLVQRLQKHSVGTWAAFENIEPGEKWDRQIEAAISQASIVCVIASNKSIESDYVRAEVERAITIGKGVVPICIDDHELPLRWNTYQYLTWRIKGNRKYPLRGGGDDFCYLPSWETLDGVIHQLCKIVPKTTSYEFIRLLEDSTKETSLKDLVKSFYEWVPYWEISTARERIRTKEGSVEVDKIINGELVDIEATRKDSTGTRYTYLYLGSPHSAVFPNDQSVSMDFLNVYRKAMRHMEHIRNGYNRTFIILYSRRMYWKPAANKYRKSLEIKWHKYFGSNLHIMSYDRLID